MRAIVLAAALGCAQAAASQEPAPDPASTPSDLGIVLESFSERCFQCHGPDKQKGALRLDDADDLLFTVVEGEPTESPLYERVVLPAGHREAMPPKGERLSPRAIEALERWIAAGAPIDDVDAELRAVREARARAARQVDDARERTGARIEPIAVDQGLRPGDARLVVDWSHARVAPGPERLAALAPLAARIHELGLAGVSFPGDALGHLPDLPALRRVHLERSNVDDAGVRAVLERAPGLSYLNLHSTAVTTALAADLEGRTDLERLVLFGTPLTERHVGAPREGLHVTPGGVVPRKAGADRFGARQPRRILAADASRGRIALLREVALGRPETLWEHSIRQIHDLQWLGETVAPHGRVLFQETWTRLVEVDTRTGEVVWSFDAAASGDGPVEVHSFRRLDDGTTMVAESGRARIVLVRADGSIEHTIPLRPDSPSVHHDTRLVRPTPDGTFLVTHERDGVVREYGRDGSVVWEYEVPLFDRERAPGHGADGYGNQVFAALRTEDGDTWITTGNGHGLLRVAHDGTVRRHIAQSDLEGVTLAWTTVVQPLSNGNVVLGNCHAGEGQPQLVEIAPDGEVVWRFHDFERFGDALSNAWVIEADR